MLYAEWFTQLKEKTDDIILNSFDTKLDAYEIELNIMIWIP